MLRRTARVAALALLQPLAALLTIATIVGFFGARSTLLDLASHFRMSYAIALAPIVMRGRTRARGRERAHPVDATSSE